MTTTISTREQSRRLTGTCGLLLCALVFGIASVSARSQTPVAVGAGSYASTPQPSEEKVTHEVLTRPLSILEPKDQPIPTNQWWTNLLVSKYTGQLWEFPMMLNADDNGLKLFYPVKWNQSGSDPVSDDPLKIGGDGFRPIGTFAKRWGDWTLTFRDKMADDRYIDCTLGRGMPLAWFTCQGVAPTIQIGNTATFFNLAGNPADMPVTSDCLGIQYSGRNYGVYAPNGTQFALAGDKIALSFSGADHYFVVAALPHSTDLATFRKYAFALPTDSKCSWSYDPIKATVTTTWHIETVSLKGENRKVVQGWLPHHYRNTTNDIAFADGMNYLTPRGTMKCAVGSDFTITYPFTGIIPAWPAPVKTSQPNDYDPERASWYLQQASTKAEYGNDTYWGGKNLTQMADYMWAAHELHDPSYETLKSHLTAALTDWYTYTPGENAHYFAYYPSWHALIGFKTSYGSEAFNDNHFHYGYFTRSTALLGMLDPKFLKAYGPMATMVAKQYANWDRTDTRFPFMRTFDIWEGHSWASGLSSPTGDNQESSSEAIQSWVGLFLLGQALGNKEMAAAGAMGYATETQAVREYWFDEYGTNFPKPNYAHPIAGMVWSGGKLYGTYFSGDPAWIFGIQWLPLNPGLQYLTHNPDYARNAINVMLTERAAKGQPGVIAGMGSGLGNVILSYAAMVNPDWAADQMAQLWSSNDPIAKANDTGGLTYYELYSERMLGRVSWDYHVDLPCSCVYYDARTKTASYVAYNLSPTPVVATVWKGNAIQGTFDVPAGALVRATSLKTTAKQAAK